MATKRVKKTVLTGITRAAADEAFANYAAADAKCIKITSTMDEQFTRIREKYQEELNRLNDEKTAAFDIMQAFSTENKEELFKKKRSVETQHGSFGFRTGTPKLKTKKGFTWAAVTNLLKIHLPSFVRTTEEPAKDLLLSSRDNLEITKFYPECGIEVGQDEVFFVECKKEDAPQC